MRDVSAWIGDSGLPRIGAIASSIGGGLLLALSTGITEIALIPARVARLVQRGLGGALRTGVEQWLGALVGELSRAWDPSFAWPVTAAAVLISLWGVSRVIDRV